MKSVRVGLLGCGTVGGGVVQLLRENGAYLSASVGAELVLQRVLVRDLEKGRVNGLDRNLLTTNAEDLLGDPTIDVFVELLGGSEPSTSYVRRAIESKRSVVTANKMMLALHGPELIDLAGACSVDLAFEGSVGGGIPIIRVLRDALASDWIESLRGIVNGTSNFILTRMRQDGLSFAAALAEAQANGYAEADPALDIGGHDAAHKLAVLAMLAFGARVSHESVHTEGIAEIEPIDHHFAERFGFTLKHLAIGRDHGHSIELHVHPALVRKDTALANVNGVLNAIELEGRALGPALFSGRGAGALPTAVSVVSDLLDVARARTVGRSGAMTRALHMTKRPVLPMAEVSGRYYLRFEVYDRAGVLATIAGALGKNGVSIEQVVQQGGGDSSGLPVQVVMLTHDAKERAVSLALDEIHSADFVARKARLLRIC